MGYAIPLEPLVPQGGAPQAPAQPADPMQDPGFRAFVAQRAQQMQDLKEAQAKAAATRDSAGFKAGNFLTALGGGSDAEIQSRYARAGQPVADVLQRQEAERNLTTGGMGEQQLAGEMQKTGAMRASLDPGSPVSRNAKLLAQAQGLLPPGFAGDFTAADYERLTSGGKIQAEREKAKADNALARSQLARETAANSETARHNQAQEDIDRGRVAFDQTQKGRVPETEATKIVNQGQALQLIDELEAAFNQTGLMHPMNNAQYQAKIDASAGGIAAGALPQAKETPGLMEEFKRSFPGAHTTNATGKVFFAGLRKAVANNRAAQVSAAKAGAYNPNQIAELERQGAAGTQPKPAAAASPQDAQAMEWAKANPGDPRAKKILDLNQ